MLMGDHIASFKSLMDWRHGHLSKPHISILLIVNTPGEEIGMCVMYIKIIHACLAISKLYNIKSDAKL